MPDLIQSLLGRDLGHLRIVAELWGVALTSNEVETALKELSALLLDPDLVAEVVGALPVEAGAALEALAGAEGRMPWAAFARRFGELREAGPGRRDREQIYRKPVSTAEILFYRAFLARAFFDSPSGAQEFAYIPEDLLQFVHHGAHRERGEENKKISVGSVLSEVNDSALGRPASPKEREHPLPASDRLLDDATTLLAALRMGVAQVETAIPVLVVQQLLQAANVVVKDKPQAEAVKKFLEMPRPQALAMLAEAWQTSETFNELRLLPGLACEGEWTNQPLVTREFLLDLILAVPEGKWWSLPAFVRAVKEKYPDFQRPAGDYDSWFIRRTSDGAYLRGFASWDEVDGALVRYLITGPLAWLGMVDLAAAEEGGAPAAFLVREKRVTSNENGKLAVSSNGRITVPRLVPRVTRYLVARFCEWEEARPEEYRYRVTTGSLKRANEQGLKVGQLLTLLAKNASAEIPPAYVKALKRWEANGTEARVETQTILRLSRPEVLEELRKSKAGRFLGEALGPAAVVVKPGAGPKVMAALAEMGLLAEDVHDLQRTGAGGHEEHEAG